MPKLTQNNKRSAYSVETSVSAVGASWVAGSAAILDHNATV